jgi:hypothetical protein
MSKFPETATAIGTRLSSDDQLEFAAPWGVNDLTNLIVRPTPFFADCNSTKAEIYEKRVSEKNWGRTWTLIHIIHPSTA